MSISWYKLKITKQSKEYECYIRFKFDFQMQSFRIRAFLYLTDSEGNITYTEKKNKLGYDPRIVGSLTVEKNFLKHKRRSNINNKAIYYEVMKYQGNFNICNLPLIDDYFRNGKALIYQYRDLISLMNTNKYKIQLSPKKFTIIFNVLNYGNINLNLFSKLEEVEKQELIFLQQNDEALCHRYFSKKVHKSSKNKKEGDEIEIIEEDKNFNRLGGRIFIGGEDKENLNNKGEDGNMENLLNENYIEYDQNSDESSVYDSNIFLENENNEKLYINKNQFYFNGKDFISDASNSKNSLSNNQSSNKKSSKSRFSNFNNNYLNKIENNENYNNLFIRLKKEDFNIINNNEIKINNYKNENSILNSNKKELNFYEKGKIIVNKYNFEKENKEKDTSIIYNKSINNNFNLLCKRIISQKANISLISDESERKILLCSSGFDNMKYDLKLLYKATLHGDNVLSFQNRCKNKKNLFFIILTLDNQKFGFYTSIGLTTDKKEIYDNNAFLFKMSKGEIDYFNIKKSEIAFYGHDDYILYLGGEQLIIRENFLSGASSCGVKMKTYKINNNYQINNGNKNFIIKEMEVYSIFER